MGLGLHLVQIRDRVLVKNSSPHLVQSLRMPVRVSPKYVRQGRSEVNVSSKVVAHPKRCTSGASKCGEADNFVSCTQKTPCTLLAYTGFLFFSFLDGNRDCGETNLWEYAV
jgi:hypothetical protein